MAVSFTTTDLDFILEQIKMAETNQPPVSPHLAFGLREVAGTDNNSVPGQGTFGSADQLFPHTTDSLFRTVTVSASMLAGPLSAFAAFAAPDGTVTTTYASSSPSRRRPHARPSPTAASRSPNTAAMSVRLARRRLPTGTGLTKRTRFRP